MRKLGRRHVTRSSFPHRCEGSRGAKVGTNITMQDMDAVRGTTKPWVPAMCQDLLKDLQALSG